jgi:hypothetical protein
MERASAQFYYGPSESDRAPKRKHVYAPRKFKSISSSSSTPSTISPSSDSSASSPTGATTYTVSSKALTDKLGQLNITERSSIQVRLERERNEAKEKAYGRREFCDHAVHVMYGNIHNNKESNFICGDDDYKNVATSGPFSQYSPNESDALTRIYQKYTKERDRRKDLGAEIGFNSFKPPDIAKNLFESYIENGCEQCAEIMCMIAFTTWIKNSDTGATFSKRTSVEVSGVHARSVLDRLRSSIDEEQRWCLSRFVNVESGEVRYALTPNVAILIILVMINGIIHPFGNKSKVWINTSFIANIGGDDEAKAIIKRWQVVEPNVPPAESFEQRTHQLNIFKVVRHFNALKVGEGSEKGDLPDAAKGKKAPQPASLSSVSFAPPAPLLTKPRASLCEFVIEDAFKSKIQVATVRSVYK